MKYHILLELILISLFWWSHFHLLLLLLKKENLNCWRKFICYPVHVEDRIQNSVHWFCKDVKKWNKERVFNCLISPIYKSIDSLFSLCHDWSDLLQLETLVYLIIKIWEILRFWIIKSKFGNWYVLCIKSISFWVIWNVSIKIFMKKEIRRCCTM